MKHDLILICDGCGKPIADNAGYLWIDNDEIGRTERAIDEWRRKHAAKDGLGEGVVTHTLGDLLEHPDVAPWMAHHSMCDPYPDANAAYSIEAGVIRTWERLLDWTAQLMEKPWLPVTDWNVVLRGVYEGHRRLIAARR